MFSFIKKWWEKRRKGGTKMFSFLKKWWEKRGETKPEKPYAIPEPTPTRLKGKISHADYLRNLMRQMEKLGRKGRWLDGSNINCKQKARLLQGRRDYLYFQIENEMIREQIARRAA